jgi:hypothetical protein
VQAGDTACSVSDAYTARTARERAGRSGSVPLRWPATARITLPIGLISDDARRRLFGAELEVRIYFPPAESLPSIDASGHPAASLPLHWSAQGLPVGVQIVAPFGDEATIFRLAAQIETARPWKDRRPPLRA